MKNNSELEWICSLFWEKGIDFWLDSGTLLGITREGRLLAGDGDIDLGMWASEKSRLNEIVPSIKAMGFDPYIFLYRGLVFKYRFVPVSLSSSFSSKMMEIDINLFRQYKDYAWCPQVYRKENVNTKHNPLYYINGLPRYLIQMSYKRKKLVDVSKWPWTVTYKVFSWWVPAHFFNQLKRNEQGYPVPGYVENYLEFRYGDWRIPNKDWSFFSDDGAIKYDQPEALVDLEEGQ